MGDEFVDRAEVPRAFGKELVACFGCRLVKTKEQFKQNGCDNCSFLHMDGNWDEVHKWTTSEFSGIISVMEPSTSWACKWKHLSKAIPGCYAMGIQGRMHADLQHVLENNGINWFKVVE